MTVIRIPNQTEWFDATLLKKSIAWMKARNDGRFDAAIEAEEEMLKSFLTKVKAEVKEGKAASLSSAA